VHLDLHRTPLERLELRLRGHYDRSVNMIRHLYDMNCLRGLIGVLDIVVHLELMLVVCDGKIFEIYTVGSDVEISDKLYTKYD
jgi:hypothetical protein